MAKILIADDEPEIIEFCTFTLQKLKHTVLSAETGPRTLEKLKSEKPDLLLLDVMLPGMDGSALQLQLSQDADLARIPVIIITALKPAEPLFDKFDQVASFLSKPFRSEDLVDAVDRALSGKSARKPKPK